MGTSAVKSRVAKESRIANAKAISWPYFVALAGLFLLTYAAGVFWVAQASVISQREQAISRLEMLADNLSASAEPLLAGGELSAVRRLISEAGYQQKLDACRVILRDGETLVDANLDKPQLHVIPASWPQGPGSASSTRVVDGVVDVERVVPVIGKGEALLVLSATLPPANSLLQPILSGAVLVGVLGLALGLLILKKLQGRLAVLTLIRGALRDAGEGTPDLSALTINPAWGREAEGWNRLIALGQKQQREDIQNALAVASARSGGGNLDELCESLGLGLLLVDQRGKVLYCNSMARILGLFDEAISVGSDLSSVITEEQLRHALDPMLSSTGPARIMREITLENNSVSTTLRVTIRRISMRNALVLSIEDVTQQRIAETSRHDFVSQATHELRTPLTNIRLYVETAQTDGEDDKELRGECLNVISRESQRLERLVSEMLSVSEIEAGSMTLRKDDVRLDQLFKSLQQDYTANASKKQIALTFDLPPKLPAIQGDRDKLAIVVQNLLGNAIKYTPEGGSVNVSVDLSSTELIFEVRDSGIGISEEDQKRVFEKFYRANDPRLGDITGSGLGLALAYEIVRLHGGEMSVESVLNEGSTFRFTLPIQAEGI